MNNQNSHFALAPHADIKRSRFNMPHSLLSTMNSGLLYPLDWMEILPGDSIEMNTSILTRMQTLTVPLMSDIFLDCYYFFVPLRLLWSSFQQFMGENDQPWYDETEKSVPQLKFCGFKDDTNAAKLQVKSKTVSDYIGLPLPNETDTYTGTDQLSEATHMPIRAYIKIWNDWFRNENIQAMATFNTEDSNVTMDNTKDAWYGGSLLPVTKYKDYFTAALPQPQKGPEVTIGVAPVAPVFTGYPHSNDSTDHGFDSIQPMKFKKTAGSAYADSAVYTMYGVTDTLNSTVNLSIGQESSGQASTRYTSYPSNLWADISNATGISINELRLAFATQKFYERSALGGTRYIEILDSMFGVTNGDARLQRSEFLGGNRVAINVNQVLQQSETGTTPLGNLGAYSLTTDRQDSFVKSFTEHGILMFCACIRYPHFYNQGLPRKFTKKDKFDYYWPLFANIGEQPIFNKEIYLSGDATDDEGVFAYQEAWSEYRYQNNVLSGEMRTNYAQSLDFWHLGDDYASLPSYSSGWIVEDGDTVNRALAVSSNVADQFLINVYFDCKATRPMPLFSVPGLHIM